MLTSYFSRFDKLVRRGEDNVFGGQGISIARSVPRGTFCAKNFPKLAPSWDLLSKWKEEEISWGEYTEEYELQLIELDPKEIYDELCKLADPYMEDEPILLCWEGPNKFCHRYIVANWLEVSLGVIINEL